MRARSVGDPVIEIDIPCDVQDEDDLGMPYALLSEARHPSLIAAPRRWTSSWWNQHSKPVLCTAVGPPRAHGCRW
jgi:hypothetical protein